VTKNPAAEAKPPTQPTSRVLRFRLEMKMPAFVTEKDSFLSDLARALQLPPDSLRIVDLRMGCVLASVEFDDLPDDLLLALLAIPQGADVHRDLMDVLRKWNVSSIVEEPYFKRPYVKRFADVHRRVTSSGRRLTWLHVSDLHARADLALGMSYQDDVTSQFVDDLPPLLGDFELEPDLVFFTGDLAHAGQADEYAATRLFIDRIYKHLPNKPQLFTVPGNHDVTWGQIDPKFDDDLDAQLENDDAMYAFLYKDERKYQRDVVRLRLAEYLSFVRGVEPLGHPQIQPYELHYSEVLDHHGYSLGIAGLNSAWRSTTRDQDDSRNDRGRLLVGGAAQLRQVWQHLERSDFRIALIHHPPDSDWFKDFDRRAQRSYFGKFDFVLRGHEHLPAAIGVHRIGTDDQWVHVPAGALYNTDGAYPKSANVITVNLETGEGMAFFWRYFEDNLKWRADVGLVQDGRAFFDLPPDLVGRLHASLSNREKSAAGRDEDIGDAGVAAAG
jgi:3',5'-cyclic AMP phosphodiesterase CpdA